VRASEQPMRLTPSTAPRSFTSLPSTDAITRFPAMPPRLRVRSHGASSIVRVALYAQRRCASSATASTPEIYDVVCVGGGPAGLSLLTGLRTSPLTSGLRVALIEGQDLHKNKLPKDAPLDSFSNRCSSLTPASVKNLQGKAPSHVSPRRLLR
jgi:ubiquinone biosynthesis monooxygenase Coq6